MYEMDERLIQVVPHERQLRHQRMEFYGFIHFTVNTFTDREWGDGTEDEALFNPTRLDARQWARAFKSAGMTGMILTCKHHDGFCLWTSAYTRHSVASSPFRGDVVRLAAEACRAEGLKFGVYLSPWDRNSPLYGSGKAYDDYFVAQLTELLTGYGPIFCVWFDGACGEGPNGKKQYYDWDRYYAAVRALQPEACVCVCGPDVRWCGNEAGDTREAEWSVVPRRMRDTEKVASLSQQADDPAFRLRKITAMDRDLGSRAILAGENDLIWYPAEVDTSIRPGWFYHSVEDDQVRPLNELIDIYERSVGGNATLLLNVPPTREGLLHENDVARLKELGDYLKTAYGRNLAEGASFRADAELPGFGAAGAAKGDFQTCWRAPDGRRAAALECDWGDFHPVRRVVLQEDLRFSQRIERFEIDLLTPSGWQKAGHGLTVGYKRILPVPDISARALRVRVLDSRVAPTLAFVGVY